MLSRQNVITGLRESGPVLTNALLFQATWFACVIGGALGEPLWGFAGVLALTAHSWFVGLIRQDLRVLLALGIAGFAVDTAWIRLGILDFGGAVVAPSWIVALWLGFGLTVNHSMGWLRQKPVLAAALAALFAPVTYLAGARLGAVEVTNTLGLALISVAWALIFLVLFAAGPARGYKTRS